MRERAFYMILLLDRFYLLRCIMTSVMQCLPAQLPDLPTSALASLNESVLVQVGLATQANSKRPKQHLKLSKAQTFSIEDLPDEVTTALIYQNFLHQDLCSLAQVSWRYRHLSVSTASKLDRLGIKAPGSLLVSVEFCLQSADTQWEALYKQVVGDINDVTREAAVLAQSWKELFRCKTVSDRQAEPWYATHINIQHVVAANSCVSLCARNLLTADTTLSQCLVSTCLIQVDPLPIRATRSPAANHFRTSEQFCGWGRYLPS